MKYNCVVCVCCIIVNFRTLRMMFCQKGEYVTGLRLLSYHKNMWLRTICCLQIIWRENRKLQQRSWSATILHREDMAQAGCD